MAYQLQNLDNLFIFDSSGNLLAQNNISISGCLQLAYSGGGSINDSAGNPILNVVQTPLAGTTRNLQDELTGPAISFSYNARYLYDGLYINSNWAISEDYHNRFLINQNQNNVLDWQNLVLSGNWNVGTGTLSVGGSPVTTANQTGLFAALAGTNTFNGPSNTFNNPGIIVFGAVKMGNSGAIISDSNGNTSINPTNRFLVSPAFVNVLDWKNLILSGNWNVGTGTFSVGGNSVVTSNLTGNIAYLGNTQTFTQLNTFNNGIKIGGGSIEDSSNNISVDVINRHLIYSDGSTNIVDWGGLKLSDISGNTSVAWNDRQAKTTGFVVVMDWGNQLLKDNPASRYSVDWNNRFLYDSGGNIAIDYYNKNSGVLSGVWNIQNILISGSTVVLASQTGVLATASSVAQTGATLVGLITSASAGVISVDGISGSVTITGAPIGNVTTTLVGSTVYVSGNTGAYANFVYPSQTGNFLTNGQSGTFFPAGLSGTLAYLGNTQTFTGPSNTFNNNVLIGGNLQFTSSAAILDLAGNKILDITTRNLDDSSGIAAISAYSRTLYATNAPTTANITGVLNWQTQTLSGNWNVGTGTLSVQGNNVITVNQTGTFLTNNQSGAATIANINLSGNAAFGAGIYTFNKTIAPGKSPNIVSISGTNGTQIFDLMVMGAPSGFGVAKKYSVVSTQGVSPIYALTLNSGPIGGNDFITNFLSTGVSGNATLINITNTGTITGTFGLTLWLGGTPSGIQNIVTY